MTHLSHLPRSSAFPDPLLLLPGTRAEVPSILLPGQHDGHGPAPRATAPPPFGSPAALPVQCHLPLLLQDGFLPLLARGHGHCPLPLGSPSGPLRGEHEVSMAWGYSSDVEMAGAWLGWKSSCGLVDMISPALGIPTACYGQWLSPGATVKAVVMSLWQQRVHLRLVVW